MGNACCSPEVRADLEVAKNDAQNYWYFGVGTMINHVRMKNIGLVPIRSEPAELLDHKHYFYDNPGMSEAIYAPGCSFHGVIHRLTPEQIQKLDKMMAGHYVRKNAKVKLYSGAIIDVVHYVRENATRNSDIDKDPDQRFLDIMIEGAQHYGVKQDFIRWL